MGAPEGSSFIVEKNCAPFLFAANLPANKQPLLFRAPLERCPILAVAFDHSDSADDGRHLHRANLRFEFLISLSSSFSPLLWVPNPLPPSSLFFSDFPLPPPLLCCLLVRPDTAGSFATPLPWPLAYASLCCRPVMQQFLANQFDDAAEIFSSSPHSSSSPSSPSTTSVLASANAAASFLALGSNRRCIKECTRGLEMCSSHSNDVLFALTAPRLLLYRGAANGMLGTAGSSLAIADWQSGFSQMKSGDVCPVLGDVMLARMLEGLSAASDPQRAAEDVVKMLATTFFSSAAKGAAAPTHLAPAPVPPLAPPLPSPPVPTKPSVIGDLAAPTVARQPVPAPAPAPRLRVSALDYSALSSVSSFPRETSSPALDRALALGNFQVNGGLITAAANTFDLIIEDDPSCAPAYVGRGSVKALSSDLPGAFVDFSAALRHSPPPVPYDMYKRRGQVLAALGRLSAAQADLVLAASLMEEGFSSPVSGGVGSGGGRRAPVSDPDVYNQLGNCLYKSRCFHAAIESGFSKCLSAVSQDPRKSRDPTLSNVIGGGGLPALHNMVGLSYSNLGDFKRARESFLTAFGIDSKSKEAISNLAQLYKDYGNAKSAIEYFDLAISVDREYVHAFLLRGHCYFAMGELKLALSDFALGSSIVQSTSVRSSVPTDRQSLRHMLGMSNQSLGSYRAAVALYDAVILEDAQSSGGGQPGADAINAWFNKEIAVCFWSKLDEDVYAWDLDREVDAIVKEGWCKRTDYRQVKSHGKSAELLLRIASAKVKTVDEGKRELSAVLARLAEVSSKIGSFIQLKSPGFISNRRQHRQFGLAVLEASQSMKRDSPSSLTWRECFSIIVKWRQLSEPNDPVWWIDQLPMASFEEGFGLQTPLVSGEFKVFRYYPYFDRGFELMKKLVVQQCKLNPKQAAKVEAAKSLAELWNLVGGDFWVVVPCRGGREKTKTSMEGTRFTLQKCGADVTLENSTSKNGFEFTIRTPGTPARWVEFSGELDLLWEQLRGAVKGRHAVLQIALKIFYFWVCFAPLTRGSAACGYCMLVSILRVAGFEIEGGMLEGVQLDWEAIIRSDVDDFVCAFDGILTQKLKKLDGGGHTKEVDEDDVRTLLPTIRSRIEALNV